MILNDNQANILCYFAFATYTIKNPKDYDFPKNLKFVFKQEDIYLLESLIKSKVKKNLFYYDDEGSAYYVYNQDIENVVSILINNLDEYLNHRDENIFYIYVDDIVRFSDVLYRLWKESSSYSILKYVWLRMSPNEFDNIYKFLERQILFRKNEDFVNSEVTYIDDCGDFKVYYSYYKKNYICEFMDYKVYYEVHGAGSLYETDKAIEIFLENESDGKLILPKIYFEVLGNENKKTCHIYAIQTSKKASSNEKIENSLIDIKRKLRNKYVNYKFILALKFFIEILRKNNIYDIKVPLLQIFNYDFHVSWGENLKEDMSYWEDKIKEGTYNSDNDGWVVQIKEKYDKVADKQDVISKNKTERLIGTFMTLEEKFGGINILSEPFIQDENLIVKVLNSSPKKSLKRTKNI